MTHETYNGSPAQYQRFLFLMFAMLRGRRFINLRFGFSRRLGDLRKSVGFSNIMKDLCTFFARDT